MALFANVITVSHPNVMNVSASGVLDVRAINEALVGDDPDFPRLLPHLAELQRRSYGFEFELGLDVLPREPGVLLVRGARQYGKSTWLEQWIARTVREHGPGTAVYLNGDVIANAARLVTDVREVVSLFSPTAPVRRLFVDEITSIAHWERALKQLLDAGQLRDVLVVTTGSKATDLRRGSERLPGRKGRLDRTNYLFTPISYREFLRVCGEHLGETPWMLYLLSGGSPMALNELATYGKLGEFVVEATSDWIYGEIAASGRGRASLVAVMQQLVRLGGAPIGQAKLAREAGLANNTVSAGFIEMLADLTCIGWCRAWDPNRRITVHRKPAKFPFINLLVAVAWSPVRLRSAADFVRLPADRRGCWLEWLVAQELWRRKAIAGDPMPEELAYWRSDDHELDYVRAPDDFLEVKQGRTGPMDFTWFPRRFPRARLTVLTTTPFEHDWVRGITIDEFLREA